MRGRSVPLNRLLRRILVVGAVCLFMLAGCGSAQGRTVPDRCIIKPGQRVLFFGDSIIAPGMFSHVANALTDRLYPGHGITFHSAGWAGTSAKTILPRVPEALKGREYDWIILNLAHNDVGQYGPEEFQEHAATLLKEIRKMSRARLAWMSVLGNEPSPDTGQQDEAAARRTSEQRAKQKAFVGALKEICTREDVVYLPMHEAFEKLLAERSRRGYQTCFTFDHVHPNLVGSWLLGAALLQCLGLEPDTTAVDVLIGDSTSNHSRRPVEPIKKPVELKFDSLFLALRLVLPPAWKVACAQRTGIVLDGLLSDWKGADVLRIAAPLHVTMELEPRSAAGRAATMRTCRDEKHLYFAFEVQEPDTGEGTWFPEIVELLVDGRKDTTRSGNVWQRTPGLTQFAFHRDFTGKAGEGNVSIFVNGDKSQGEAVRAAARKVDAGYVMEVTIPVANFKQVELTKGYELPFAWAVSFTDQALNLDLTGLMGRMSQTRGYARLILE